MATNRESGTYLKCHRHNAYVERGDFNRIVHVSAHSKRTICEGNQFFVVTIEMIDRDAALAKCDQIRLESDRDEMALSE